MSAWHEILALSSEAAAGGLEQRNVSVFAMLTSKKTAATILVAC